MGTLFYISGPVVQFFNFIAKVVLLVILMTIDRASGGLAFRHLDVPHNGSEEDIAFARAIDADFPRAPTIGDYGRIGFLRKL